MPAFDFTGRTALVTGAGQGVGRQIALDLAAHGAAVAVNDYYAERSTEVVKEITSNGGVALSTPFDVTDLGAATAAVAAIGVDLGPIDILVNNAGNAGATDSINEPAPFWETDPADWNKWLGTNLYGVLNTTRAVLPTMVEHQGGRVVSIISDAARVGEPHLAVYSAAKAGAAGFMRAIAKAVGRYGITANCVALGATITPTMAVLGKLPPEGDHAKKLLRNYSIRRFGTPDDASAAVVFLASNEAAWITAQTLPVNGGYSVSQ